MSRDEATLLDMLTAGRRILEFKRGLDKAAFLEDLKTQSSVLHQLMVLGEAAKRLSSETRQMAPDVPWQLIAGMRDHLIHGYDDVDLEEVWKTSERDVPALIERIERLLQQV
ncbi:MAG TPA: DUF86 domain-containing protein [Thermoanaerobaculia bacterium]